MTATVTIVLADVAVGDRVTETDTPEGPFCRVTKVGKGAAKRTVHYATDEGETFSITANPATASLLKLVDAAVKVCRKDPSHGEHRVTKSGSYCYMCDRIVAERQKAERAAAQVAS